MRITCGAASTSRTSPSAFFTPEIMLGGSVNLLPRGCSRSGASMRESRRVGLMGGLLKGDEEAVGNSHPRCGSLSELSARGAFARLSRRGFHLTQQKTTLGSQLLAAQRGLSFARVKHFTPLAWLL